MKKYVLGIGLLGLSGLVLFQHYLPRFDLSIWKIVWFFLAIAGFASGLFRRRWYSSFFFGTVLFILLNQQYGFLAVDTRTIIIRSTLACIGCSILFKPEHTSIRFFANSEYQTDKRNTLIEDENAIAFGSSTRYIHDMNFVHDTVDVSFGSATIYFDDAQMAGEEATFEVDAAFSTVQLYVPKTWLVQVRADKAFSTIQQASQPTVVEKRLLVKADLAFSSLVILNS